MCKRLHVLAFFYIIFYKLQAIFPNQLNYSDIVMKDGIIRTKYQYHIFDILFLKSEKYWKKYIGSQVL